MAQNTHTLADKDGEYLDWIEIHNRGDAPAPMAGWRLTDSDSDPERWVFPDVTIDAGGYLVLFASDKNITTGAELHTNFRLDAGGDYLALVRPDGTAASEFAPEYPNQTADVSYGLSPEDGQTLQYFTVATPGAANQLVASRVLFSQSSRSFNGSFVLTLSLPPDAAPTAQIRYTTDRSYPVAGSSLYTGPLTLTRTTVVRAVVYESGVAPGPVTTNTYVSVDATVLDFNSNLPVVVLDTFGAGLNSTTLTPISAYVIDTAETDGRARMLDLPDFAGRGGLRYRGQSSESFPKKQLTFETWDEGNKDKAVSILDMPAESDWVLYAPYSEKSLMQNFLVYQWADRLGQYAVRTRYVEVFLNTDGGSSVNYTSDYVGVYIFMERIKVDEQRVDIAKLTPQDNAAPDITGGYIFKNDKNDGNETGFTTARGYQFLFSDPGEEQLTSQQKAYITSYMNEFESVLYGASFKDPVNGYAKYIDVGSWIDHHILTELAKNIDGFRISTYFTKDRDGKVKMGPMWDFNLSMGNANYNEGQNTSGWYYSLLNDSNYRYFRRLFEDADFAQKYIDRWTELRRDKLSTASMMADVDALVTLLSDGNGNYPVGSNPPQASNNALVRNFKRWNILGVYVWPNYYYASAWIDEIAYLKNFLTQRAAWIDSQYLAAPVATRGNSLPEQPVPVTLAAPGGGTIYYTLTGTDPRLSGGALSPAAQVYTNVINVTSSTRVTARVLIGSAWSGLADLIIGIDHGLRVTEVNYHPDNPPAGSTYSEEDYEFIELINTGDQPIDLTGHQFSDGIDYTVEPLTTYGPLTLQEWLASGGGTSYFARQLGAAPGPALTPAGDALRLLSDAAANAANRIAFDRTSTLTTASAVTAEFDLAAYSTAGSGTLAGAATVQDFSGGAGQTSYAAYRIASGSVPGATVVSGGPTGDFLRLITDGNNNQNNRLRFDRTLAGSYGRIVADFDFRLSSVDTPADGFSILFLPTSTYGATGTSPATNITAEEPNLANTFAVGFDVYQANDVSLHWNGSQVQSFTLPTGSFNLAQGGFHHVRIELVHVAGGAQVSVSLIKDAFSATPQTFTVFTSATITGLNAYDSRVEFAARSGGANMSVDLDNIDVRYVVGGGGPAGISALLLPTASFGATGAGTNLTHFSSKPNVPGVFALDLAFDAVTGAQELSLHYGSTLQTIPFSRSVFDLASGQSCHVKLDLIKVEPSGVYASVTLAPAGGAPVTLASNVLIPGLTLTESRLELAGRSTSASARIDIDNVRTAWLREESRILQPGGRAVIARSIGAFAERYGTAGGVMILGSYLGNLANDGERVTLLDAAGAVVADFTYSDGPDWPGRADGRGSSLEAIDPFGDLSAPGNWRSSSEFRGSPGYAGVGPLTGIIINEVLSNSDPLLDSIELFNASAGPIDISGWYLSDSPDDYAKFRIPDGTILQPGQYAVFDEGDFNPTPVAPGPDDFALDGAHGDDIWLLKADPLTGTLLAFADSVHFGAALSGEAFGRWPSGSPTGLLEPMTSLSLGSANSGVRFGPVVISEVMYHPAGDVHDMEFVEVYNPTAHAVDLSGWRLDGAVSLVFPAGTTLAAGACLVAVPFGPAAPADAMRLAAFRLGYPSATAAILVGPYTGRLDNAGERLRLERPDVPPYDEPTFTPYVLVDQFEYGITAPWPVSADGGGDSLTRVDPAAYTTNPANWVGLTGSPGLLMDAPVFLGTEALDRFTLRLDPAGMLLQVFPATGAIGSPIYSYPLADIRKLTIIGFGGDDSVWVDFTYGSPIPSEGLHFDGGNGNDALYVNLSGPVALPDAPVRPLRLDAGAGTNTLFIRGGNYTLETSSAGTLNVTADMQARVAAAPGPLVLNWLTVNTGARFSLAPDGASPLVLNNLVNDGAAALDLANNTLAVWGYVGPATMLPRIEDWVRSARNSAAGAWTGNGITTSAAALRPHSGLATVVNNTGDGTRLVPTLGGVSIPADWIIVKFTGDGDSDLNGVIDGDDYFRADLGFLSQSGGYARGDLNYDGRIDIDDYFLLDTAFSRQSGPLAVQSAPMAPATIPDLFGDTPIEADDLDELDAVAACVL